MGASHLPYPAKYNAPRRGVYNEKGDDDHTLFANGEQERSAEELMKTITEA